jgi:hypothetical protein
LDQARANADPRFARGPIGFFEEDPVSAAKGLTVGSVAGTIDMLGMAQQGINTLGDAIHARLGLGKDVPRFRLNPVSGDPLRESFGLDPDNPQGMVAEMFSPGGAMAKGATMLGKGVAATGQVGQ